jgi:hypothetical protein
MKKSSLMLILLMLGCIAFAQQDQASPRAVSPHKRETVKMHSPDVNSAPVSSKRAAVSNQSRPARPSNNAEAPSPTRKAEK